MLRRRAMDLNSAGDTLHPAPLIKDYVISATQLNCATFAGLIMLLAGAPMTKRKIIRKSWTTQTLRELQEHSKRGTPVDAISQEMQRTIGALRQQAFRMKIPLGARAKLD